MDELLAKLKALPVVGALFKGADGGSTSSEFGLLAALVAVATANASTMSLALGLCLGLLGVGVGLFAIARGRVKTEASAAAPKAAPAAAAALLLALFLPVFLLGGCANQQIEPYRLSVEGMAKTGDAVRPLVRKDLDPSEQAIVDAWDFQRAAGHKLAEAK